MVVNFLNRRNEADRRVLQLLTEKFSLFNGVFGASDEVLGSIESGVDFVELACGKAQQFTVALAGPPHLRHGLHFVPVQGVLQSSRQALVKQDTHESAERSSPVPER